MQIEEIANPGSIVLLLMRKILICQNPRSSVYKLHSWFRKCWQPKPNISLCFRLIAASDLKAGSSFSSPFQLLQVATNRKVNYGFKLKVQIKTRNATGCNNWNGLLHLSFALKISIFSESYYITQSNIWDGAFIAKIERR